jgi:hypothetical protein
VTSWGTVAKYLSEGGHSASRESSLRGSNTVGRRDYVPLAFRWRCGSGTTFPHSTQRTMPASCSSSRTKSEIKRLCVQAQRALIGRACGACPDSLRFTVHLSQDGTQVLQRIFGSMIVWYPQCKTQNMGMWAVSLLIWSVGLNGSNYMGLDVRGMAVARDEGRHGIQATH